MSGGRSTSWYWSDWLGAADIRLLPYDAKGLWMDCLALMSQGKPYGYLVDGKGRALSYSQVAQLTNGTPDEVERLLILIVNSGVASRDRRGRIFCRRMQKMSRICAIREQIGSKGGQATALKYFKNANFAIANESSKTRRAPYLNINNNLPTKETAREPRAAPVKRKSRKASEAAKPPSAVTRAELDELYENKTNGDRTDEQKK